MNFAKKLLDWYHKHHRKLPWRETTDPYRIWLSEIIMQQTRVDQGMAYYERFVQAYPTVNELANASEDEVLKLWQGLGYYSRARNLHATARHIQQQYHGKFPTDYASIRALKGVGDYTAAAIGSFAFELVYPVVDGNVMRVISRLWGVDLPIDSSAGKKRIYEIAQELIDPGKPGLFNQAMMEFGSLQCAPRNPDCLKCVFQSECHAFEHSKVDSLPFKAKKIAQKDRYFNYLVIEQNGFTFLQKRTQKGIWQNLYEFPLFESNAAIDLENFAESDSWASTFGDLSPAIKSASEVFKHILSHQRIHARFWQIELPEDAQVSLPTHAFKVKIDELDTYAIPRLIDRYLNSMDLSR